MQFDPEVSRMIDGLPPVKVAPITPVPGGSPSKTCQ